MADENQPEKMTEEDLITLIGQEEDMASGVMTSDLSFQREKALNYYLGKAYGNEVQDKSQFVTREVMDTVEWMMPYLMKIFFSGEETVKFEPTGPEDVGAAAQATDYTNYIWKQKNPGFKIAYQWIKDALIQKNGIVKVWYDDSMERTREEYEGISETQLNLMAQKDNIEVVGVEQIDEMLAGPNGEEVPFRSFNATLIRSEDKGQVRVEPVPPEEFRINKGARSIETAMFCQHVVQKTISELRALGYDVDDLPAGGDTDDAEYSPERIARYEFDNTNPDDFGSDSTSDAQRRLVWVKETYIRTDFDGDGLTELRKVVHVGSEVLFNEEVAFMPFAGWTPIMMSHKFYGLSISDTIMDLQLLQSTLTRNMLDNQYANNNGRYEVVDGQVNLDDLLTSRPGGVVRVKAQGAVTPLSTPQLSATAFQMLEHVETLRERRTGVSARTQGMDENAMNSHTTATQFQGVMSAALQKIELIARVFAETGLKDMFLLIHNNVAMHQNRKDMVRLRNEFVEIDPSDWKERKDMTAVVGLGNGNPDQRMRELQAIQLQQQSIMQSGGFGTIVQPKNLYALSEDMVRVNDKTAPNKYFTDPGDATGMEGKDQPTPEQQAKSMDSQAKMMDSQTKQADSQTKQAQVQGDLQEAAAKLELDRERFEQEKQEWADNIEFKIAELHLEDKQQRAVSIGDGKVPG